MEHVLMLGNGFDLYYKLPTKYNNFLQIVSFLSKIDVQKFESVGAILNTYISSQDDSFVAACYSAHQKLYDQTPVIPEQVEALQNLTKDNIWFQYLLKSFNKDVGWIDFEKEISTLIYTLYDLLAKMVLRKNTYSHNAEFSFGPIKDSFSKHIIQSLPCFFYRSNNYNSNTYLLKDFLSVEYPLGSELYIVDKDKIITVLSTSLSELSEALNLYLSIFAESILNASGAHSHFEWALPFRDINRIITFNYTKTYEQIYYNSVHHLHGSTDGKIVLGINPDKYDEVENADTLYISFKKYYQRVMYGTATDYLSWINQHDLEYTLMVMGHSLDVTDADIIMDLFSKAKEITIIYHDDNAKSSYIGNIIKMYGKSGFDRLRRGKKLDFRHIDSDFTDIIEARKRNKFNLPPVYTFP